MSLEDSDGVLRSEFDGVRCIEDQNDRTFVSEASKKPQNSVKIGLPSKNNSF